MSAKPCDSCNIIIVNNVDLWLMHSNIASLPDGANLEFRELKARFSLLGACTSCPLLRFDLEACTVEIKDLKHQIAHSSHYSVYLLHMMRMVFSRVSFFMLSKRTPSFSRRSLISQHVLRKPK
jgi:hypothetical protein